MIWFGVYRHTNLFSINLRWSCFLYAAVNTFLFLFCNIFFEFSAVLQLYVVTWLIIYAIYLSKTKKSTTRLSYLFILRALGAYSLVFFLFVRAERISFIKGVVFMIIIDIWNRILFCHAHWVPFTSPSVKRVKLSIGLQASMSL